MPIMGNLKKTQTAETLIIGDSIIGGLQGCVNDPKLEELFVCPDLKHQ